MELVVVMEEEEEHLKDDDGFNIKGNTLVVGENEKAL